MDDGTEGDQTSLMDATHLTIEALLGVDETVRRELRMRARTADPDGWVELQKERTPEPSWFQRSARGAWRRLAETGRAQVVEWIRGGGGPADQPRELEGWLVPVWRGDNDIEEPVSDGWAPAAVLLPDRAPEVPDALYIDEVLPEEWSEGLPAAFRIRWMRQPVLRLRSKDGLRGPAVARTGDFALVRNAVDTLVAVLDLHPMSPGAAPTERLPGYTERLVPVSGFEALEAELPSDLRERLHGLVE